MAAPVIVTGLGVSAASATVISGASIGVLSTATSELGKHANGMNVTLWESVRATLINGTIGGLTAGVGQKISPKFGEKAAKYLAPKLASQLSFMSVKQIEKFLMTYFLAGRGLEVIKTAVGEAIKLVGTMMNTGKVPTQKDFFDSAMSCAYTLLLGELVAKLGSFQKKWLFQHKDSLMGTLLPQRLASLAKGQEIPKVLRVKMWTEVVNKVSDEGAKAGFNGVISQAIGGESDTQLVDMATKAMLKDKKFQQLIDREMLKAMKKHGISTK